MKKLGTGYYYNVFDLGNGRVLKKEKGWLQTRLDIYRWEGSFKKAREVMGNLKAQKKKMRAEYEELIATVDPALIGNPVLKKGIEYEQDRCEMLGNLIDQADSLEEVQHLIDLYADSVLETWRYGFSDRVYNFSTNSGIDAEGRCVLFDFNEISFCKAEVAVKIDQKCWLNRSSFKRLNDTYKPYCEQKLNSTFTLERLQQEWETKKNRG